MTEQFEDKMEEGIEQITKFKGLEKSVKESMLYDIFKKDICDIAIVDILLGWRGFGTHKIWNKLEENNITPLNFVLLNQYIK